MKNFQSKKKRCAHPRHWYETSYAIAASVRLAPYERLKRCDAESSMMANAGVGYE